MSEPAILYAALHTKAGAELLNETVTEKQIRFMVRVKRGQPTTMWLSIVDHLIMLGDQQIATGKPEWTIDISKQYFRRPDLKYGWRVILQSSHLKSVCEELAQSIGSVRIQSQAQEIQEVALHGSPSRKSGGLTGHVATGPLAR